MSCDIYMYECHYREIRVSRQIELEYQELLIKIEFEYQSYLFKLDLNTKVSWPNCQVDVKLNMLREQVWWLINSHHFVHFDIVPSNKQSTTKIL